MPSKLKSTFERAQTYLRQHRIDGWLLHDFQGNNPILWQLYGSQPHTTRRVDLLIPVQGNVRLLVSAVDAGQFRDFPGDVVPYLDAQQYRSQLAASLKDVRSVAMEYSAGSSLPVVSRVDAGTIELVRGMGVEVVSSADLVQYTVALWTPGQAAGHRRAAIAVKQAVEAGFRIAGQRAGQVDEFAVVQVISDSFNRSQLTTSAGPIAAVNAHSGDPHYEPTAERSATIQHGDWLLIDAWAKQRGPEDAVYADITWVAVVGRPPSDREQQIFRIVRDARDAAIEFLHDELSAGRPVTGAAVDRVARQTIGASGYGDQFIHRLGHSIGTETHSNGVNLDGFETNDTRTIMPGSAFSVEPGIYLPDFGVRLEVNALAHESGVEVTTELQQEIVLISCDQET